MKYKMRIGVVVFLIVLILLIGAFSIGFRETEKSLPSVDTGWQSGVEPGNPTPEYTETQELPIPPIIPQETKETESEKADLEFDIENYRPVTEPSAEKVEIEYDSKE